MKEPFEQSIYINMKIANWKTADDEGNENTEELIKNIKGFGIDIKSDSKIDYLKKKLESDTSFSMKELRYKKENGLKTIVLDGVVYTKAKENKMEGMVWTKTELQEDKYFSNSDRIMKQLVKFKDNIKKSKTKTDTIYAIEFDDDIRFDDLVDILGEENATFAQLKELNERNNLQIKDFEFEYIIDNKGNLKRNDLSVTLEVSDEDLTIEILVTLKGEYKNIGKPLEINIPGRGEEESKKPIDLRFLLLKKDGKDISLDLEAIIVGEKILVPVQKVVELLEAKVSVDKVTGEIKIEKDNNYIIIRKDRDFASANGFEKAMPLHSQERDGVNYIPLSFVVTELGGVAIIDSEKSEINILTVEAVKKDLEEEQKEFERKYSKLYHALEKLKKEPYKQNINFIDKVYNIKVDNRTDIERDESYVIQSKVDYLASYDFQGHAYDEIDHKNRIRKSRYEDTTANKLDVYKSDMVVMNKKLYHKIETYAGDKASWKSFDLENDDKYFQPLSTEISLFSNDIIEEKDENGTKFTIKIDSTHENKAALKRFIYDRNTIVPYEFSKDNCELKNLEINYLVDEDGNMKTKEIKYLIKGTYKIIQMDFQSESKIEFEEVGKPLEIEKPIKTEE